MFMYAELWNARPAWLALSQPEREQFFATLGPEVGVQLNAGCELVGLVIADTDTPRRGDYQYLAIWRMAEAQVPSFEEAWERLGWHGYFEQINVRGTVVDFDTLMAHHIQAS